MEDNRKEQKQLAQWRIKFRHLKNLEKELDQHLGYNCAEHKLDEYIEKLTDNWYSLENIVTVVGSHIALSSWDGRYDKIVKEWADLRPIYPQPPGRPADQHWVADFTLNTHPVYINMLAERLIDKEREALLDKEFELMGVFNKITLFTDKKFSVSKFRFLLPEVPIHYYFVRGADDDPNCFSAVERLPVLVNYVGTLLSYSSLMDEFELCKEIGELDLHYSFETLTLGDYIENYENAKQRTNKHDNGR